MSSRTTFAIAAMLAAGGLAISGAGAQQSGAQGPSAHARAHPSGGASTSADAEDLKAKGSYSVGVLLAAQLPRLGLENGAVDVQKLIQGLKDEMSGKAHLSKADEQNIQAFAQQSRSAAAEKNAAAARRFLASNGKRPGVKTTKTGLQYKVITPGSGATPQPTDQVTVNYRGTLLDGTVFDSSYDRGKPATFVLNQVIPGWQEGVGMMKPGAKWQLYIPPELAYGANSPPPIPPNSLLKFDVELLKVAPPASASPSGAGPNVGGGKGR